VTFQCHTFEFVTILGFCHTALLVFSKNSNITYKTEKSQISHRRQKSRKYQKSQISKDANITNPKPLRGSFQTFDERDVALMSRLRSYLSLGQSQSSRYAPRLPCSFGILLQDTRSPTSDQLEMTLTFDCVYVCECV